MGESIYNQYQLKNILFLIVSICFYVQNYGQTSFKPAYLFRNYSVDQGLPSSEIYDIENDHEGNIWFATDRGVVKYNGDEFITFHKKDGLIDEVVYQIHKDAKNRLWFLSGEHQLCYYENEKIKPYQFNQKISKLIPKSVHCDKDIKILNDNSIFLSNKNVKLFYKQQNKIKQLNTLINGIILEQSKIVTAKKLNKNFISFGNFVYDLTNDKPLLKLNDVNIVSLNILRNRLLIGGVKKGLFIYHFSKNRAILEDNILKNVTVTDVLEDNNNGFWISTLESGVFYLPNYNFKSISTKQGLISNEIKNIYEFNDTVYVGLVACSYHKILNDQLFSIKNNSSGFISFGSYQGKMVYSTGNGILCNGKPILKYWLRDLYSTNNCVYGVREFIFRFADGAIDSFGLKKNSISLLNQNKEKTFSSVIADEKGNIFAGNKFGLSTCFKNNIIPFKPKEFSYRVTDLAFSKKWGIIIATRNNGIYQYKNQKFIPIKNNICQDITCLYIDEKNILWAGTVKGLLKIQTQPNKIQIDYISKSLGLISNEVISLFVNKKTIWVGTKKGLTLIDKENFQIRNRDYKIYLKSVSVNKNQKLNLTQPLTISYYEDLINIKFRASNFITKGRYKYRLHSNSDWSIINDPEIMLVNPDDGYYQLEVAFLNENNQWSSIQKITSFTVTPPFWRTNFFKFLILLGALFLIYLYIQYKRKQFETKQKLLILEQKALFAQMNPHFIFNTLNSIQSFHLYNEMDKAEYFLGKFSKLLRETLHISRSSSVTVAKEIDMLEKYLELEQMRFSNKFEWQINCDFLQQATNYRIPNMLIQPFIENSIRHGFTENHNGYKIDIQLIYIHETLIKCQVIDNGIGRKSSLEKKATQNTKGHISYGEKITSERLASFNKKRNHKYGFQIIDLNKGTMVEILIPILKL
ncbi:MAG: sensor histidine kinase [Flavobacteriia bacterium]|nr:sensor histidine kinase [Flavobacteriia bacterium]